MKKITINLIENIIGTFIPLVFIQLFVLPKLANYFDVNQFGLIIILITILNVSSSIFGSTLNNSYLINYNKNSDLNYNGDFNLLLIVSICINTVLYIFLYFNSIFFMDFLEFFMFLITANLMIVTSYISVEFRIKLNYRRILYSNLFLFVGYIIGYLIFLSNKSWIVIYLVGYLFNCVYIQFQTSILKRKFYLSVNFIMNAKKTIFLLISSILSSFEAYADKIIIFPILGSDSLTIYNTATLVGKMLSLASTPIISVLLSYIIQIEEFTKKNLKKFLIACFGLGLISYFFINFISGYILEFLYPKFYPLAKEYVWIASLSTVVVLIYSIINLLNLRFREIRYQLVINLVYFIIYLPLVIYSTTVYSIYGLVYAILFMSVLKLCLILFLYFNNFKFRKEG